jgi:hypothetical protein
MISPLAKSVTILLYNFVCILSDWKHLEDLYNTTLHTELVQDRVELGIV